MNLSASVLEFVQENYVGPARAQSQPTIEIKAGEVHARLNWSRRVPLVCSALNSRKLQKAAGLELIEKSGPPSGQSTTMVFRYRVLPSPGNGQAPKASGVSRAGGGLLAAYGAAAHLYRQAGGSDAFLRAERENFGSTVPDLPDEQEEANGSSKS